MKPYLVLTQTDTQQCYYWMILQYMLICGPTNCDQKAYLALSHVPLLGPRVT